MSKYRIQLTLIVLGLLSVLGAVVSSSFFLSSFLLSLGTVTVVGNIIGIFFVKAMLNKTK